MNNQLLPPNATPHEIALAGAASRISGVPVPIGALYQANACPTQALPQLAWSFSLDQWDSNWTEAQKRAAIDGSVYVHRHKGTVGAVKSALASLGIDVRVQEWFHQTPAATPFTFRLLVTAEQIGFDKASLVRIGDIVNSTKNLRSHMDTIVPQGITTDELTVAAVTGFGMETTITEYGYSLVADGARTANGGNKANGLRLN